jgi:sec-independent protein translocase protein TatA
MFNIGPQELFILFLIVLFLFGAKRIPEIGRSIGKGIQEFKKGMREVDAEINTPERTSETKEKPADQTSK